MSPDVPFAWLTRTVPLEAMAPVPRRLVAGLRHLAAAHRLGRCPVSALNDHLGCARASAHLQLLVEEIGQAWPEPFCLAPPCCRQSSHDETLIASMLGAAASADRPGFDRLCAEMLASDARDRLYLSLGVLAGALARAPAPLSAREH